MMRRAILVLAIAAAAALTGCGGASSSAPANASPGLKAFDQGNCGSCHTLAAAGASGTAGPKLDGTHLDQATVEHRVRTGGAGMPSFTSQLSDAQIKAVAAYVANASK
jgi:mono/diheme cytochrome c family protein